MKILHVGRWIHYLSDDYYDFLEWFINDIGHAPYEPEIGKWLIFCGKYEYAERLCSLAVENCDVREAKHSADFSTGKGVCCFYIDLDSDFSTNKKFLTYFRDNNLLPKTKGGNYVNLAFKYDYETRNGLYGDAYTGAVHLKDYMNLENGEWTDYFITLEAEEKKRKKILEMSIEYSGNSINSVESRLKNDDYLNVELIKEEMRKTDKEIRDIASFLGVKDKTVKSWLSRKTKPTIGNAMGICLYFGLSVEEAIIKKL